MAEEENKVYSFHTFILPFTWEMKGVKRDKEYTALKKVFEENQYWLNTNISIEDGIVSRADISDFDAVKGLYKEYQYYYPFVRKAVYGGEDDVCANYLFTPAHKKGTYHIIKKINDVEKHYLLHINAIRVRLVNTGIGLFILECENHGKDAEGNPQCDIDAVKNINDYGRRITLPFISEGFWITADRLYVDIPEIGKFEDDFAGFVSVICEKRPDSADGISFNFICGFVRELLSAGSGYHFTSKAIENKNDVKIWPLLDDRMYVAFAACEKNVVEQVGKKKKEGMKVDKGSYIYQSGVKWNESVYEIAYIDAPRDCSCPDKPLREKLVNDAMYNRWLPKGTFYTITDMGMGMISSAETKGSYSYLYENFLTCYLQMVYIALAQKASVVKFSLEAADIAGHFAANGRKLSRNSVRSIMTLQERHAAFESQLLFSEVSSEQQAIEMYDKLKTVFRIEEEDKKLDEKLTRLYEIMDTDLGIDLNAGVSILTWVSVILSTAALLYSILFYSDVVIKNEGYSSISNGTVDLSLGHWIFLGVIFGVSVLAWIIVRIHNRRK